MSGLPWRDVGLVAMGGALGAVARFGVSTWMPRLDFPWHTLLVNLAGSLLIGAFLVESGMDHPWRLAVAVGFLGAFTTLSTYSVETLDLWRNGHTMLAVGNAVANGIGGPFAALVGWRLVRWIV